MDLSKKATAEFWKSCPFRKLPEKPQTNVNVEWVEAKMTEIWPHLTAFERWGGVHRDTSKMD